MLRPARVRRRVRGPVRPARRVAVPQARPWRHAAADGGLPGRSRHRGRQRPRDRWRVGELHLELLRRGAARATNLELVDAYDTAANELASEAGVGDRIERRVLDIAATPGQVEPADVVVLHRVVCCYPDFERLLGAAADHAGRLLVFSHPPRNAASRLVLGAQNTAFRVSGRTFRIFAHPPGQMLAVLGARGLSPVYAHQGLV